MQTSAVVIDQPEQLTLRRLGLVEPGTEDVVVAVEWSGISTGTERLLFTGRMPPFPGLGYPLVPGYEAVGRIESAGAASGRRVGERVFVAGARCFEGARGLFGGSAQRLVVPGSKALVLAEHISEQGILLALAATAYHAGWGQGGRVPDLIVGHGALGRLIARLAVLLAPERVPTVWETNPARSSGAAGYNVIHPTADDRTNYQCICDVSGDAALLDTLLTRLAPGGEVLLAGFYDRLAFDFVPAFLREATIRVSAEWKPADLLRVVELVNQGRLDLQGIITHALPAESAAQAYTIAFTDPACVKMILDWRSVA